MLPKPHASNTSAWRGVLLEREVVPGGREVFCVNRNVDRSACVF